MLYIGGIGYGIGGLNCLVLGLETVFVSSGLVFPAAKTQSDVLGHSSAPHRVGLSLVRSSNLREKSARQIALAGCVTARIASERRPAFDFRFRLEISLAVSPRLRFIRLNTGTPGCDRSNTTDHHIFSLERQESPQFPKSRPWARCGTPRGAVLDCFVSTISPGTCRPHLGPSRSANVGAEMLARGLANKEIAGAARTYLWWSKSLTRRNPTN
jgi:hypothetical protein